MAMRERLTTRKGAVALTGVGAMVAGVGLVGLGPISAQGSSHREAPLIAGLPQYDTTDVYAFRSPDRPGSTTLIANWIPFSEPAGGPNFYTFATDARYNIHIDNDGDAKPEITYRWTFKDRFVNKNSFLAATGPITSLGSKNLNYYQTYRLKRVNAKGKVKTLVKNRRVVPSHMGDAAMPNYQGLRNAGTTSVTGGIRSFAGQAEDPFFLDLRVFDLLYGADFSETGDDTLAGFNVNSVALQVPSKKLAKNKKLGKNPIIGVWSTTDRKRAGGGFQQVSRLGMPLVNEVVIPLKDKNKFNRSQPQDDGQFLDYVTKPELPKLIEAIYGIEAPAEPRNDLVAVFLTGVEGVNQPKKVTPSEQLRLNMTTPLADEPNRLGVIGGDVQGFPNGRRLADDVIDIALQVVEGELVGNPNDLGDAVDTNDVEFGETFPYLALPTSGSNDDPHPSPGGGGLELPDVLGEGGNDNGGLGFLPGSIPPAGALGLGLVMVLAGAVGVARRRPMGVLTTS